MFSSVMTWVKEIIKTLFHFRLAPLYFCAVLYAMATAGSFPVDAEEDFVALGKDMLIGTDAERKSAANAFIARGDPDIIPTLVLLMRIRFEEITWGGVEYDSIPPLDNPRFITAQEADRDYFAAPDLKFPAITDQSRLLQKEHVYGIRIAGGAKAWPLDAYAAEPVINDRVGFSNVDLIGDANTRTVRAYDRGDSQFTGDATNLSGPGGLWQISEDALVWPDGQRLPRLSGHVANWFAWDGYLGAESELYENPG